MDFRSRGVGSPTTAQSSSSSAGSNFTKLSATKWLERGSMVLLISLAILIAGIAALTFFGGNSQAKSIIKDKYQAVFLNNGQVYFGNITDLNNKYVKLQNIYYLQTNNTGGTQEAASTENANVTLVKLGCELHAPYDQMLINSDQVLFWENLKDTSEVVKKIAEHKKANPDGQKCSTASQSSTEQATPAANTQTTSPAPAPSTTTPARRP